MKHKCLDGGYVFCGDSFSKDMDERVSKLGKFPLIICDPPYGKITKEKWDNEEDYMKWFNHCSQMAADDAVIAMWGGIGKYRNRPFVKFAFEVENVCYDWKILNWITWSKKRAYGVSDNYLFTREECLILSKGNPVFNIPLLSEKRGYAGYNKDYPAKSEFLRRTNVWMDINEIFKGKIHPTQKPDDLYDVLVQTHSNKGDTVYDPCAGSLTTMRSCIKNERRFVCVERDISYIVDAGISLDESDYNQLEKS